MNTQALRNSLTGRKKSVTQLVEQWEEIPVKKERVSKWESIIKSKSLIHIIYFKPENSESEIANITLW